MADGGTEFQRVHGGIVFDGLGFVSMDEIRRVAQMATAKYGYAAGD